MGKTELKILLAVIIMNLVVLVFGQQLQAASPLRIEARGRVTAVHDDYDLLDGAIQEGDGFVLYAAYDAESKLAEKSETTARYLQHGPGMKIVIADRVFVTGKQPFELAVLNAGHADSLVANGSLQVPDYLKMFVWHKHSLKLMMLDRSGAVFNDTSLPTQLGLKDWSRASCRISFVRSTRLRMGRLFPAASVIVDGVVEDIRLVERPTAPIEERSGENEHRATR